MRRDPSCAGGRAGTCTLVPFAIGEHLGLSGGVVCVSPPIPEPGWIHIGRDLLAAGLR